MQEGTFRLARAPLSCAAAAPILVHEPWSRHFLSAPFVAPKVNHTKPRKLIQRNEIARRDASNGPGPMCYGFTGSPYMCWNALADFWDTFEWLTEVAAPRVGALDFGCEKVSSHNANATGHYRANTTGASDAIRTRACACVCGVSGPAVPLESYHEERHQQLQCRRPSSGGISSCGVIWLCCSRRLP